MSAGPLRRVVCALGLLALAPLALSLAAGTIEPEDAALRAVTIVAVVLVVGRLARAVLTATLRRFEADEDESRDQDAVTA